MKLWMLDRKHLDVEKQQVLAWMYVYLGKVSIPSISHMHIRVKQSCHMLMCHFNVPLISSVRYQGWPPAEVLLWTAHEKLWRAACQSSTPRKEADKPLGGRKVTKAVSRPPGWKSYKKRQK